MSKTKGNVIDPLVITEKYGADALRFTLAALTSAQGRDIKLAKDRIEGFRAFANKLWNATRFALMNLEGAPDPSRAADLARSPADRWVLARLARAVNATVDALEAFRFDEAASTVYRFCWNDLCDWYIELSKEALYGDDAGKKAGAQAVLAHALDTALRLLHPMMPFVTEELWQMLGQRVGDGAWPPSLLEAPYPARRPVDEGAERSFGPVLGVIEAIRNVRGEMNVPWKTVFQGVEVGGLSPEALATLRSEQGRVERLGNVQGLVLHEAGRPAGRRPQCAVAVGDGFEVLIPLAGAVDMAAETARVDKEIARLAAELDGVAKRLANPSFVEKAPPEVVEEARARVLELGDRQGKLEAHRGLLTGAPPQAAPAEPGPATPPAPAALARREPARLVVKPVVGLVKKPAGRMVKKGPGRMVRRQPAPLALPAPDGKVPARKRRSPSGTQSAAPAKKVAAPVKKAAVPAKRKAPTGKKKVAPSRKARPSAKKKGAAPRRKPRTRPTAGRRR
jgi:valyl-tRNA synthetase